jgi:hypothetical protein
MMQIRKTLVCKRNLPAKENSVVIRLNYQNLFDYLIDAAICQKDDLPDLKVDENSRASRWAIDRPQYRDKLFIKQRSDSIKLNSIRFDREERFYRFLQDCKNLDEVSSLTLELLHFDRHNSILIYQCSEDYRTLKSAYESRAAFPIALATRVGTALAKLHSQTINSQECYAFLTESEAYKFDNSIFDLNPLSGYLINPIEPEDLNTIPVSCWRFLGLFQQADAVKKIVTDLILNHRRCCLTHNNIQFSNILISRDCEKLALPIQDADSGLIKVVDWETISWGDPACDLGKAMLGYFLFWLDSMIVHPAIEIKKAIQLATIPLGAVHPSMIAMTQAYINTYPKVLEDYPAFLQRVIQFAGLGLIDQLLTEFHFQPEMALNHQNLYFFIAAQLLCKPEKFLAI